MSKYEKIVEYLKENDPDCFFFIISIKNDMSEAFIDVVNTEYEDFESAKKETIDVLTKLLITMLKEEGRDTFEYFSSVASCFVDNKKSKQDVESKTAQRRGGSRSGKKEQSKKRQRQNKEGPEKSEKGRKEKVGTEKCSEHPTYGAIRKPRSACKRCWEAYRRTHESHRS